MNSAYISNSYIISSLGFGVDQNFNALKAMQTNCVNWISNTPIHAINDTKLQELLSKHNLQAYNKTVALSILSIKEMLLTATQDINIATTKLILSTTKGNIHSINSNFEECFLYDNAQQICDILGIKTKPTVISNACISGVSALIYAKNFIEENICDNVIVVGIDFLSEFVIRGFNSFKSLSKNICKPYDKTRDGLNIGEACACVLVSKQGDIIISGGAISSDANHISGPSRTGDGLSFAINQALTEANIASQDIQYLNMHGTATIYNDEMESKAATLSNLDGVPLNSLKSYFGHTLGASGVLETIMCCEQIKQGIVIGQKYYNEQGTPHKLNISQTNREIKITNCVKTASGFGGCNAAIVLSKNNNVNCDIEKTKIEHVVISKIKYNNSILQPNQNLKEFLKSKQKQYSLNAIKFSKMDDLCRLGYIASYELLKDIKLKEENFDFALILANRSSSLQTDLKHQANVDSLSIEDVSPAVFVYTLPNIVAGEISIAHKIKGECTFFIQNEYNEAEILSHAKRCLNKTANYVIYGWCELLNNEFNIDLKLIKRK